MLEYQLYDGSTRAVGSKVYSNSLRSIQMNMPSVDGNYSLNLIKQNFPNDVVKLSGSIPISVVSNFKISISLPSGYELNPFGWNQSVEICRRTEKERISIRLSLISMEIWVF
ncbi:hypothetical protein D3H35_25910 [Cohnella faecalis]|uniref:Uncharacterized protein n=1 Tax=Cohnella faecalis TaxID=2315694 RepID=A0A398CDV6_9BACL|nr:hypothetical protein D3H35_25910 [Cohnella faecalis]